MQSAVRRYDPISVPQTGCSLFDISQRLGVPVVVANHLDASGVLTHSTFGLDLDFNWAEFAGAVDDLCSTGAVIVPNIEDHDRLGHWVRPLVARDIRFFAGLPLRDYQSRRVGSIAVMASQAFVARRGISVSRLGQLGKEFAGF
jgi:GAF domain-containing protein